VKPEELVQSVCRIDPAAKATEKKTLPIGVEISASAFLPTMKKLREDQDLSFDMLLSHTAVDWVEQGKFELFYVLYSLKHRHYLMVSTFIPRENPVIPTFRIRS